MTLDLKMKSEWNKDCIKGGVYSSPLVTTKVCFLHVISNIPLDFGIFVRLLELEWAWLLIGLIRIFYSSLPCNNGVNNVTSS